MIFVDSNIPMYLIGAAHFNKKATQKLLENAVRREQRLITDVEVFPIEMCDVETARSILEMTVGISARDALHVAVMRRYQVKQIMRFDSGFDRFGDLVRMS